jgi:hypothetical protein
MTPGREEEAHVQAAHAAGQAAWVAHANWAENMEVTVQGSDVAVEPAAGVDDIVADGIGSGANPTSVPVEGAPPSSLPGARPV